MNDHSLHWRESMSFDAPVIGSPTPWGIADYAAIMAPGLVAVGTPSHGGI